MESNEEVTPDAPIKILAIEDDPEALSLYISYFGKRGYRVVGATNKDEAMYLVDENPDAKIIIAGDLRSRKMTSEQWLSWFLEHQRSTAKIIVASGANHILSVVRGNNGVGAITKPFHAEELLELVEVLLDPSTIEPAGRGSS